MSGTSKRVGDQNAANTIGMQMAATGFGVAIIPSLMGVLARRTLVGDNPCLPAGCVFRLFAFYVLATRFQETIHPNYKMS